MRDWLDARTGFRGLLKHLLDEPIPSGVGWWFVTGSIVLFLLAVQLVTGSHSHSSTRLRPTPRGQRALHRRARHVRPVAARSPLLRRKLHRDRRGRPHAAGRRIRLLQEAARIELDRRRAAADHPGVRTDRVSLAVDQKAYWATTVTINITRSVPLVGDFLSGLLRGGTDLGALTLMRWYRACLSAACVSHGIHHRAHLPDAPARHIRPDQAGGGPRRPFYPYHALRDTIAVSVVFALLLAMAIVFNAPLDALADPTDATYVPRPEWYLQSLFELLKYFPGRLEPVATVIIPGLVIILLLLLPFLDRRPDREPAKRPLVVGGFCVVLVGITLLTVLGYRRCASSAGSAAGGGAARDTRLRPTWARDGRGRVQERASAERHHGRRVHGNDGAHVRVAWSLLQRLPPRGRHRKRQVGGRQQSAKSHGPSDGADGAGHQQRQFFRTSGGDVLDLSSPARHAKTPRLDQLYSEAATELDDVVSRADGVPPVNEIIDKYLQAIGGPEKAAGITSVVATGKVEAFGSFGGGGNFEYFAEAPDKRAMHSHLPSGESIRTFDGRMAGLRFRWPSCPAHWQEVSSTARAWTLSCRFQRRSCRR